ncbi:hypothetical protein BC828DRAFT_382473 [Blastocladiella britannica]|nr:hypothetical protein BC828DRAFT_382473 [Blastocladiella britannica]
MDTRLLTAVLDRQRTSTRSYFWAWSWKARSRSRPCSRPAKTKKSLLERVALRLGGKGAVLDSKVVPIVVQAAGKAATAPSSTSSHFKKGYERYESSSSLADTHVTRVTRPCATADQSFATGLGLYLPLASLASGSAAIATAGKGLQQWLFLPMLPEAPAPLTIKDLL